VSTMQQLSKQQETEAVVITDDTAIEGSELMMLAKLLDVLMEVDFEINRNKGLVLNAC
jgi:hypothetical protein